MAKSVTGELLSAEEIAAMEFTEKLEKLLVKRDPAYQRQIKSVSSEQDFQNLRYQDVPVWFRVANYVLFVGLPAWGLWKLFT